MDFIDNFRFISILLCQILLRILQKSFIKKCIDSKSALESQKASEIFLIYHCLNCDVMKLNLMKYKV